MRTGEVRESTRAYAPNSRLKERIFPKNCLRRFKEENTLRGQVLLANRGCYRTGTVRFALEGRVRLTSSMMNRASKTPSTKGSLLARLRRGADAASWRLFVEL